MRKKYFKFEFIVGGELYTEDLMWRFGKNENFDTNSFRNCDKCKR